jgi:F420H(2)-dependent biliverdin reductase
MARRPADLRPADIDFLTERHLATLTTLRADGTPHVVPVGFTYDASAGMARVICSDGTQKVANVERSSTVVLCQVSGAAWLSLEGRATVARTAEAIAEGERRYTERYQAPRPNDRRVVIEITVDRILGKGPA